MSKNTLFKLYTADYSADGYEHGITAAKDHQPKNKFTVFRVISPINYVWGFNNAFDSFTKNYEHGYLDGQRVNNHIYQPTQSSGKQMASSDNYSNHLRMLEEVQILLTSLKRYLYEIEQKYQQQINALEAAGFMQEYTDQLKQKQKRFAAKIADLISMIEQHDGKIEAQQALIQRLKEYANQE